MNQWISDYINAQKAALDSIPVEAVAKLIKKLKEALHADRQIFVFGNGGSASNASHFITDLGKGSSDKVGKTVSLYPLAERQYQLDDGHRQRLFLRRYFCPPIGKTTGAKAIWFSQSVSAAIRRTSSKPSNGRRKTGWKRLLLSEPNAGSWRKSLITSFVIDSTHYGRVEDAQMAICHMLCYAFIENPEWGR